MTVRRSIPRDTLQVLLCDADGNLFPSEEPAFAASARVTNALLASLQVSAAYSPHDLRVSTTGKNFRSTALQLCARHGVEVDAVPASVALAPDAKQSRVDKGCLSSRVLTAEALEQWVRIEAEVVSRHLAKTLKPDRAVTLPLRRLARRYSLAAVSSSALMRLRKSFDATGLSTLFPPGLTFSAEDSLPSPVGKPDPAVYRLAGGTLRCTGTSALAIEDSPPGVTSAVSAGFPVVGNLQFVPASERLERAAALLDAGACQVVESWQELANLLAARI